MWLIAFWLLPGKNGSTVTSIFSSTTGFWVSFPIRLNRIYLWALFTFPLLLSMLSAVVFLDSCKIPEGPRGVVVNAWRFRANVGFLFYLFTVPLLQLPGEVMAPPVKLQVLISLETLVTDLTNKSISGQKGLRR